MDRFKYMLRSGKNNKVTFYARNFFREQLPDFLFRQRYHYLLKGWTKRPDREAIRQRVEYYCKLQQETLLPEGAPRIGTLRRKDHSKAFFYDSYEYLRCFQPGLKWCYLFGDVRTIPPAPTILKSRPIAGENANSVLLNLNKIRHFVFLNDGIPFREKCNKVIFRGEVHGKPERIRFMETWYGDPDFDLGDVGKQRVKAEWHREKLTLYAHLDYKFVMALEGNDVASNLKWVMSSNSLAVMPRPSYETWFMEGKLIPNYHYVEIKPDYSDLKERMQYYIDNPEEAEEIIRHAHEWVAQFLDKDRERITSLLVLQKYFRLTNPAYKQYLIK